MSITDRLQPDIPPNRNVLYRSRKVIFTATYSSPAFSPTPTGTTPITRKIELSEVSSIDIDSAGSTAVGMGQVAAFMQPWYFGPFKINVSGKSYIGAMRQKRLNIATDTDVKKLMELRNAINTHFKSGISLGTPGITQGALSAVLSYVDDKEPGNLAVNQEYRGFIDNISFGEAQQNPYMVSYSIKFTGEKKDGGDIKNGGSAQATDKQNNKKVVGKI